jgi:hypothetical protein
VRAPYFVLAVFIASLFLPASAEAQQSQSNPYEEGSALSHLYEGSNTMAPLVLSTDWSIERLFGDPRGRPVLIRQMGYDLRRHPVYDQFKHLTLQQAAEIPELALGLTYEQIYWINCELNSLDCDG